MTAPLPLLLLPGLLNDAALWAHQTTHLGAVCRPQVADLTGSPILADLAATVLAAAPARFALAGLSMGGYVAFEILRQAPERVAKLALVDTTAAPDPQEKAETRKALAAEAATPDGFAAVLDRLLPGLVHPRRAQDASFMAPLRAMAERVGAEAFQRQQQAIMSRPDSRPLLPTLACPTLVLVGQEDALTPPAIAETMAQAIPNATLRVIPDCGHLSALEQPEAVTTALQEFLAA